MCHIIICVELFMAMLEKDFENFEYEEAEVKINGKGLNYLRFADDTFLMSGSINEEQQMIL